MKPEDFRFCPRCAQPLAPSSQVPLVCASDTCEFQFWFNPTPVVAVLCLQAGGVVLAHNKLWENDVLGAITGFLEQGEDPAAAAIRETREELSLQVTKLSLLGVYNYSPSNQTIIAYLAQAEGDITLGEELDRYKIIPLGKLKPWPFGTGLAVADLLQKYREGTLPFL